MRSTGTIAAVLTLWAGTAAILGAAELRASGGSLAVVNDHFQQGHLVVSASWGLVGLALLSIGVRRRSRALRGAGVVLLFVTIGKLFLYDLSYLPATSRAASFIITGLALIAGAIVLQRLSPELLGGDGPRRAAD